ncbi:hypothetical protein D3C73_1497120 [compost metagenome]
MSVMRVCIITCNNEAAGDVPVAFFVAIRNVLLLRVGVSNIRASESYPMKVIL